jgi:hypothetical protein
MAVNLSRIDILIISTYLFGVFWKRASSRVFWSLC